MKTAIYIAATKPADGDSNIALKPLFSWGSIAGVTTYHLQISDNDQFSNIVYEMTNVASTSFTPFKKLDPVKKYWWRVRGYKNGYPGTWSTIRTFTTLYVNSVQDEILAKEISISANPNPMTNRTNIIINMVKDDNINISIYNSLGEKVTQLEDNLIISGEHNYTWNTGNIANGIYYISLTNGKGVISYKLIVNK